MARASSSRTVRSTVWGVVSTSYCSVAIFTALRTADRWKPVDRLRRRQLPDEDGEILWTIAGGLAVGDAVPIQNLPRDPEQRREPVADQVGEPRPRCEHQSIRLIRALIGLDRHAGCREAKRAYGLTRANIRAELSGL